MYNLKIQVALCDLKLWEIGDSRQVDARKRLEEISRSIAPKPGILKFKNEGRPAQKGTTELTLSSPSLNEAAQRIH